MRSKFFLLTLTAFLTFFLCDKIKPASAGWLDWEAKGWVMGSFYPPHNEFDPHPMVEFEDRIVARYGLEMNIQVSPRDYPRFFLFINPLFLYGDNKPQLDYNYSMEPIVLNARYGLGFLLSPKHHIELRLEQGKWIDMGNYVGEKLVWNALQVRWSFNTAD